MRFKCALITGAGGALGKELAIILAEKKIELILIDHDENLLTPLENQLSALTKIHLEAVDFNDPEKLDQLMSFHHYFI